MKKFLKIALITISSLIVILLVAISVLVWVVFTPTKLTPIVRENMAKYITCKTEIGQVELTFFSTFPQFGLKINNLEVINPMPEAPSDTLLTANKMIATLNMRAWWKNNEVILNDFSFDDLNVNAFIDKAGKTNFDIMKSDTSRQDTSAFKNPFKSIQLNKVNFNRAQISYVDLSSKMMAKIDNLDAELNMILQGNDVKGLLDMTTPSLSFKMDTIAYFQSAAIQLHLPLQLQLKEQSMTLKEARMTLNRLAIDLNGNVRNLANNGGIYSDVKFKTSKYPLKPLLEMIPAAYTSAMKGMEMTGEVEGNGTIAGIYKDEKMPLISMNLLLNDGTFKYADLPYKINEMKGDIAVRIDFNNTSTSNIQINKFSGKSGQSSLQTSGFIKNILGDDMLFDMNMNMQLNLAELKPMLPKNMPISLKGTTSGNAKAKFSMSQLDAMDIAKMDLKGTFDANNLTVVYDTILLNADKANLTFTLPNKAAQNKAAKFLLATIKCNQLGVKQGKNTSTNIYGANLSLETSNIMDAKKLNTINCKFDIDLVSASMNTMTANIKKPSGELFLKANMSDSTSIPSVSCNFDIQSLAATMDTTSVNISYPKGQFSLFANKKNPKLPEISINYESTDLSAQMGSQSLVTKQMIVKADVIKDDKQKDMMLQWIPTGSIAMHQGLVKMNGLTANIQIPTIQFDFTPEEYIIKDSKVIIDKSDFQLQGKLSNVNAYIHNTGLLKGVFNFNSNTTDVVKLMELTNGIGNDSVAKKTVKTETAASQASSGPYMVPKGIDISLHTTINRAYLGTDTAKNVLGDLYIKNGTMALENMRFVTSAGKMQLTALYQSPRKNHLFAGLDFHILDMEISELLKMVPDIDTIMPMLRSFGGKGEFHMAIETYMDSSYNLKKSTLLGVSSIKGENLVLMDGETFSEIAKTLRFSKKTKNKVDSLSAEFTIFKNEVDIYPFLIVMDKYKAVVAGRHNLDMTFNYHISVVDSPLPFRLGIDVKGTMDKMKFSPAKCKYANLYRPAERKEIVTKQLEIRKMLRDALTKNVIK